MIANRAVREIPALLSRLIRNWPVRFVLAALLAAQLVLIGIVVSNAQSASSGYTPRGYRYDANTCSAGFQPCMSAHLRMGWQNAASSSYCSQACGVFPPQSFDRHSGGNW